MGIAGDLIIIIIAGLLTGLIASRLRLPPIVGYIIAGIIIGPHTGGITVSNAHEVELLAEIGVALLLFSIGLDFSFRELRSVKGIALLGTPLQVALLIGFGMLLGRIPGMSLTESMVFGMVISLSSTMVVLKTLMSRGLIGTLSSKVMTGILIVQDLAAIPLMLIIPNLRSSEAGLTPLILTLVKAGLILGAIIVIGTRAIPWTLKFIARLDSREMFLLTITAIGLGVGYITHIFGLSLAFGAFVAGMVINESDYSHQALNDIVPLRDIFGLIFFTSVGMLLDAGFIIKNYPMILLLVLLIIAGKFMVFFLLSISFRYFNIMPLALGFGLAQIGEFSFVLARTGLQGGIISMDSYSLMLAVSVVTMIASPFLSMLTTPVYSLKKRLFRHQQSQSRNLPKEGLRDHIIVAGGGRVGYQLAWIFQKTGFPFVVIEQDFRRFDKCKTAGFPVIYGDAAQDLVLDVAGADNARLIIITIPFMATASAITVYASKNNPKARIIARADDLPQVDELFRMKVHEVVQPEFEASLEILRQALTILEVPVNRIYEFADCLRKENSSTLRMENMNRSIFDNMKKAPFLLDVNWFELAAGCPADGRSIRELAIRSSTGVSIVGVSRAGDFIPNPDAGFILSAGDFIAAIGLPADRKLFEEKILGHGSIG
jgi:CPA2 family monovalent cation:H+ antiporter-2